MMIETVILAAFFAIALTVEWRWRKPGVRLATAAIALLVLIFTEPVPHRAARRAVATPPAERISELRGSPLSEYESGVLTMKRAIVKDADMFENENRLALGVLVWLACSPALRRNRASSPGPVSPRTEDGRPWLRYC